MSHLIKDLSNAELVAALLSLDPADASGCVRRVQKNGMSGAQFARFHDQLLDKWSQLFDTTADGFDVLTAADNAVQIGSFVGMLGAGRATSIDRGGSIGTMSDSTSRAESAAIKSEMSPERAVKAPLVPFRSASVTSLAMRESVPVAVKTERSIEYIVIDDDEDPPELEIAQKKRQVEAPGIGSIEPETRDQISQRK